MKNSIFISTFFRVNFRVIIKVITTGSYAIEVWVESGCSSICLQVNLQYCCTHVGAHLTEINKGNQCLFTNNFGVFGLTWDERHFTHRLLWYSQDKPPPPLSPPRPLVTLFSGGFRYRRARRLPRAAFCKGRQFQAK